MEKAVESFNRETYQENAELKQQLKEKADVIVSLMEDYRRLESKYEALANCLKTVL